MNFDPSIPSGKRVLVELPSGQPDELQIDYWDNSAQYAKVVWLVNGLSDVMVKKNRLFVISVLN